MKLTKIYTKTGDEGTTSLVGGIRIAKDSPRIEAYGTIDNLSSHLGLLVAMLAADSIHATDFAPLIEMLQRVQNNLFDISTILATDDEALRSSGAAWVNTYLDSMEKTLRRIDDSETPLVEQHIDQLNATLAPLDSFILPGGTQAAAQCHVCRAVCREAERRMVGMSKLSSHGSQSSIVILIRHINRLSDYLFVVARKINLICHQEEKKWKNPCT